MNKLVAFFGSIIADSSILASPLKEHPYRTLPALAREDIHDEFGQFALRYVTAEGTVVSERGRLVASPDGIGTGNVIYQLILKFLPLSNDFDIDK